MVNSAQFSKRLQKILDYYGVSATAFSEMISFNRSTISHLLSGRNKPSLEFVMKVLEAYPEVELYWLLNGKGTFPSTQKTETSKISEAFQKQENQKSEGIEKIENDEKQKFHQEHISEVAKQKTLSEVPISEKSKNKSEIDRIIIFYKDGTFSEFKN
ncbi:MAG: helix-turn-helix domain-containing protein [Patiriisocius sp.]|uniref:helix-turn-helix domain-containing protein n=1 Tax=Patiriisocius sp. TaxID=2822396 RepID=UPI003EF5F2B9